MFVLVVPGIAGAVGWGSAVDVRVKKTVEMVTSGGKYLVPVEVQLPKTVAKETAKQLLRTGAKRIAVSVVSGPAVAVLGAAWLVYDLTHMESDLKAVPGIQGVSQVKVKPNGCQYDAGVWVSGTAEYTGTGTVNAVTEITITINTNRSVNVVATGSTLVPKPCTLRRMSWQTMSGGCSPDTPHTGIYAWLVTAACTVTVINHFTDGYTENRATGDVIDAVFDPWFEAHKEYFEEPEKATVVVQDAKPTDSNGEPGYDWPQAKGGIQESYDTDPGTGNQTDPATGQDTTPKEADPTTTDTMTLPGQPAVGTVDTSIEAPEKNSIGTLITGWLAAAPFMSIINNLDVDTSSEQCTFTILLPEVLGGSAQLDFCQFSTLWSLISTIVISVAYIYGAMIIFGGKS